jgi:hypothetical protein
VLAHKTQHLQPYIIKLNPTALMMLMLRKVAERAAGNEIHTIAIVTAIANH